MAVTDIQAGAELVRRARPRASSVVATPVAVSLRELCLELGAGRLEDGAGDRRLLTVPGLQVEIGRWDPPAGLSERAEAALIVHGLVLADMGLAGRIATQIFGPGDVLPLCRESGGAPTSSLDLTVADPATLVPLDERLMSIGQRLPILPSLLLRAASRQLLRGATQQAISQLSRIELRLLAIMWHFAERWGRMTPEGVALKLDLTHTMLGQLVGAKRPTVSLALKALAADGTLTRGDGRWLLAPDSWQLLSEDVVTTLPVAPPRAGGT